MAVTKTNPDGIFLNPMKTSKTFTLISSFEDLSSKTIQLIHYFRKPSTQNCC